MYPSAHMTVTHGNTAGKALSLSDLSILLPVHPEGSERKPPTNLNRINDFNPHKGSHPGVSQELSLVSLPHPR